MWVRVESKRFSQWGPQCRLQTKQPPPLALPLPPPWAPPSPPRTQCAVSHGGLLPLAGGVGEGRVAGGAVGESPTHAHTNAPLQRGELSVRRTRPRGMRSVGRRRRRACRLRSWKPNWHKGLAEKEARDAASAMAAGAGKYAVDAPPAAPPAAPLAAPAQRCSV